MGAFWDSWELWEKMCFVLGAAIIVTVLLGIMKLTYDHWRLRKFTTIAAQQVEETSPPMQQRKHKGRANSDIPFGVRAIESGVEVEGVWISRGNSPATSTPGSPATLALSNSSDASKYASRTYIPAIAMPKPVHSYLSQGSDSSQEDSRSPDPHFDQSVGSSQRSSRNPSPTGHHTGSRQSYKPRHSSQLRYSSAYYREEGLYPEREQLRGGEASEFIRSPSGSSIESNDSAQSRRAPHHYRPKRQPSYTGVSPPPPSTGARRSEIDLMPFTSHGGVDLNPLASHRRSQVAEMGLLMPPRSRTSSAEWSSANTVSKHSIAEEKEVPSPTAARSQTSDPFHTPVQSPSCIHDIEAPSFQSFLETDPAHVERRSMAPHIMHTQGSTKSSRPHEVSPAIVRRVHSGFETTESVNQSWSQTDRTKCVTQTSDGDMAPK